MGLLGAAFLVGCAGGAAFVVGLLALAGIRLPGNAAVTRVIPLLFGLCFFLIGLSVLVRIAPHIIWGKLTTGKVIDVVAHSDSEGTTYAPVIRYEVDGTEYVLKSSVSMSLSPKIGDELPVSFLPNRPGDGWVQSWAHLWLPPLLCFGMGITALWVWAFAW